MADKKTSQAQQSAATSNAQTTAGHVAGNPANNPANNPFAAFMMPNMVPNMVPAKLAELPGWQAWTTLADGQVERYDAMVKGMFSMEKQAIDNATSAIDEIARLSKEGLAYSLRISEQWHQHALQMSQMAMSAAPKN